MQYDVEHHPNWDGEETLVIRTNAGRRGRLQGRARAARQSGARELARSRAAPARHLSCSASSCSADWLIRLEREDSLPRIVVRHLASGEEHTIAFPEEAYSLGAEGGYEFATDRLRFHYSSMTTPNEVWDYDLKTRARTLRKRQEVPSGHDPAAYVTRRIQAKAPDGEMVPISILHRRDVKPDGTAPLLLYGYGSYGYAMPASFATGAAFAGRSRLRLCDRAYPRRHRQGLALVPGRQARARSRTRSPTSSRRPSICARWLCGAGKIVAHGGSAGGLLMGAIANMRPDLFGGIIAEVPFVDVINTMLDDTLPLTPPEWQEWGNPITDAQAFRTMLGYSPYDNVRAQDYPAILVLAGLTDPRVTYWEPAKWVARLREREHGQAI